MYTVKETVSEIRIRSFIILFKTRMRLQDGHLAQIPHVE